MPETLRVSCVIAVSSESDSCVSPAILARTCPTRRCTITSTGMITIAMIVRRQSMMIIATSEAMTVTTLPRMLVTVFVSTPATPPTSFCRRDWMTPVLVRVKKLSSIACRCSKSRTRRSPVTLLPTVDVSQRLHDAEAGAHHEQQHHDAHEPREQCEVGAGAVGGEERVVEDPLHEQGRDDGDRRAHDHEDRRERDLHRVGAEERDDPRTEVRDARRLGVELLLRLDVDAAEAAAAAPDPRRRPCSRCQPNHGPGRRGEYGGCHDVDPRCTGPQRRRPREAARGDR